MARITVLAITLALLGCACSVAIPASPLAPKATATATPSPSGWTVTVDESRSLTGLVFDTSGLVTGVEIVPEFTAVRLTEADAERIDAANVIVRPMPGTDRAFLVDWGFGVCDVNQSIRIARIDGVWNVAISRGQPAQRTCDLVLLGAQLRVTTSIPFDANAAVATMLP